MGALKEKIGSYFLNNDSWMFFAIIMGASFIFLQTSHQLGWSYLFGWLSSFSLLFSGILIFSLFRKSIRTRMKPLWYWLIWAFMCLLIPILFQLIAINSSLLIPLDNLLGSHLIKNLDIIYGFLMPTFVLLELILYFSKTFKSSSKTKNWFKRINPIFVLFITIYIIIAFLTSIHNKFQEAIQSMNAIETLVYFIKQSLQHYFIYIPYYLFYYINHHFLYNRIFRERGVLPYLLSLLLLLLVLTPVISAFISLFPVNKEFDLHPIAFTTSIFDDLNYMIPAIILVLTFPIIIYIEINKKEKTLAILKKEKASTELSLLKQNINPHFFFNTLNNLYALSLNNAKETPDTILKLSELMRFVIYKGKQDQVLLSEELKYIQDYIDLQRIRIRHNTDIKFNIIGDINSISVPPLLFIILVENAFKHGIEPAENASFLHITCELINDKVIFSCHNSVEEIEDKRKENGIGLSNLQKRLHILFPDQHTLEVIEGKEDYLVKLTLDI